MWACSGGGLVVCDSVWTVSSCWRPPPSPWRPPAAWDDELFAHFEDRPVSKGLTENFRLGMLFHHGRIHQNHVTSQIRTRPAQLQ